MKIGVFDPVFDLSGHHPFFNYYVASLFDTPENQVYFLDFEGKMKKSYEGSSKLYNPPIFVQVADAACVTVSSGAGFLGWWQNRIREYKWYKNVFAKMAELKLDAVIFTTIETTPTMFFAPIAFPYIVITLYPAILFKTRAELKGKRKILWPLYSLYISGFYRFLRRAKLLFTTNEPSIVNPELAGFSVSWLPNRSFGDDIREKNAASREVSHEAPRARKFSFLTIGTISDFKNHLFAIDVFEKYNLPFKYMIAGAPLDDVGRRVKQRVLATSNQNVTGIFEKLDDDTYQKLVEETEFMLLPYDFKRGAISSQVMHDAFSRSIPIVAPDIEPFKYYVERYGVGLIYKEGDPDSLAEVLRKAAGMHRSDFHHAFEALHAGLSFPKVKEEFLAKIG